MRLSLHHHRGPRLRIEPGPARRTGASSRGHPRGWALRSRTLQAPRQLRRVLMQAAAARGKSAQRVAVPRSSAEPPSAILAFSSGRTMRIGIDAHFVGVRHGGNEIHFENLINHLAQRPGNGDDLYAFTYGLAARERLRGERLTLVPLSSRSVYWQRGVEIPLQSRRLGLDVLHVPFNVVPVFRPRKVVTIHDLGFLHVPEAFTPWERARLAVLTPVAARSADHVFAVSAFTKHEIAERYRVPEGRITITPSAVDRTVFRPLSADATAATRARLGLECDFVLFVGTLQPRKNVPTLIEAYDRLRRKGRFSGVHLVLAGRRGWYFNEVFRLVRERGLEGCVHHVGAVDTETLVASTR